MTRPGSTNEVLDDGGTDAATEIGRGFGRELAVVLLATALAAAAAFLVSPPPEESASAQVVMRAPADISNPSVVGLWIDSFELELASPDTADAVAEVVPGITADGYADGLALERRGFSVQFDASLAHPDGDVAAEALSAGIDTTVERIGTVSIDRLDVDVERASGELTAARAELDALVAETGVFDARGTYQATLSEIRALERQIRDATLLGFSPTYIAGLEVAREEAEAELPSLVELAQQTSEIDARIDETRTDLFAAEDRLAAATVDYERLRSPEALLQGDVEVTTVTEVLPWAQRIVLAAGTAFVVALLLVVLLQALVRRRRRRRAARWRVEEAAAPPAAPPGEGTIDLRAQEATQRAAAAQPDPATEPPPPPDAVADREPIPASRDGA